MRYFYCFLTVLLVAALSFGELPAEKDSSSPSEACDDSFSGDNSFGGVDKEPPESKSELTPAERIAALEKGFHENSKKPLSDFIDTWHADSKPISEDTLKKKPFFEQDVYKIYSLLFKPDQKAYQDTDFVIIQDEIHVFICEPDPLMELDQKASIKKRTPIVGTDLMTGKKILSYDVIFKMLDDDIKDNPISDYIVKDFRPHLNIKDKKVLYLKEKHLACLVGFLVQEKNPFKLLRGSQYLQEDGKSETREERLQYLNTKLKIIPGHWGRGWLFETYPTVTSIYLGYDLKKAIVFYRAPYYRSGRAFLEKDANNAWKVVEMKLIWLE